jgi:hypothetical protein
MKQYNLNDWEKLKKSQISFTAAQTELSNHMNFLMERICEIAKLICKTFKKPYKGCEFSDYDFLPDLSNASSSNLEEFLYVYFFEEPNLEIETSKLDINYFDGFPVKFLFMKNEEIVELLKEQIAQTKAYKEKIKAQRMKSQKVDAEKRRELNRRLAKEKIRIKKELGMKS